MGDELKACPFGCEAHPYPAESGRVYGRFSVHCPTCFVAGPSRDSLHGAIAAWNRRSPTWRDIGEAPKTREWKLLFGDGSGFMSCAYIGCWIDADPVNAGWYCQPQGNRYPTQPTHWMTLPHSPAAQAADVDGQCQVRREAQPNEPVPESQGTWRDGIEQAAKVVSDLGDRFAAGAESTANPVNVREQLEDRAGGCYQAAKAIRSLSPPLGEGGIEK